MWFRSTAMVYDRYNAPRLCARMRPFQGSIWVAEECQLLRGEETAHPDDDYPPAKFGLTVIVKTYRLGMFRDWKVWPVDEKSWG